MRLGDSSYKKSINALKKGARFRLFGPMGEFAVSTRGRALVFLVSGIGITPILALLKELKKAKFGRPVYLFYTNRSEENAAYHRQLQNIDMPNFEYVPVFTKTQDRINSQLLESRLHALCDFDYYLVGHHEFLQSMRSLLLDKGVDREQIIVDDFG